MPWIKKEHKSVANAVSLLFQSTQNRRIEFLCWLDYNLYQISLLLFIMNRLITYLRPAKPEDCSAIYQVHRHAVRYTCLDSYNESIMAEWLVLIDHDVYAESIDSKEKTLWVAEYHQKIQGFFQVDFQEAQLDALYVHPFVHRQGLGTAMLQKAESLAIEADLSILSLYASKNSIPFYQINGYSSLGDAIVPINAHTKINCQLMRKFL